MTTNEKRRVKHYSDMVNRFKNGSSWQAVNHSSVSRIIADSQKNKIAEDATSSKERENVEHEVGTETWLVLIELDPFNIVFLRRRRKVGNVVHFADRSWSQLMRLTWTRTFPN